MTLSGRGGVVDAPAGLTLHDNHEGEPHDMSTTDPTPAEIEATGVETIDITHKGVTYTLPAARRDAPIELAEALERDEMTAAVRALMGDEQWARFKATKPTIGDRNDIFDAWIAAIGLGSTGG